MITNISGIQFGFENSRIILLFEWHIPPTAHTYYVTKLVLQAGQSDTAIANKLRDLTRIDAQEATNFE